MTSTAPKPIYLVLYTKKGCHLCAALEEKLAQIPTVKLEKRDIETTAEWLAAYEYEVPVLLRYDPQTGKLQTIPRPSPRCSVSDLTRLIQR